MLYYQSSLNQIRRIHADSFLFDFFLMVMCMVIFRALRNDYNGYSLPTLAANRLGVRG